MMDPLWGLKRWQSELIIVDNPDHDSTEIRHVKRRGYTLGTNPRER